MKKLRNFSEVIGDVRYSNYKGKKAEGYDFYFIEKEVKKEAEKILIAIQESLKMVYRQSNVTEKKRQELRNTKEWKNYLAFEKEGFFEDHINECGEIHICFDKIWKKFFK